MRSHFLLLVCLLLVALTHSVHSQPQADRSYRLHAVFAHHKELGQYFIHYPPVEVFLNLTGLLAGAEHLLGRDITINSNSPLPDIHNKNVLNLFAIMSYDAYMVYDDPDWVPLGDWESPNGTYSFGWNSAYLRGYLFHEDQYNEAVLAFKGTDIMGATADGDLYEDWLMFSCCGECRNADYDCGCIVNNVCYENCFYECATGYTSYFDMARYIFDLSQRVYPQADFYFTGHSLGGAIAALMAINTSYPAVTFESPPARRYAAFISLDVSANATLASPVFGFGAYNDPIFMGQGACSPCNLADSPIKTSCHLGYNCVWPVPRDAFYGWSLQTHSAHSASTVLTNIQQYDIPRCFAYPECEDSCGPVDWSYHPHGYQ